MAINLKEKIPGSKYFTWSEALYLPSWDVHHIPSQEEIDNIIQMALVMDKIREYLGKSIHIHCWIRPILNSPGHERHGQDYNKFKAGAPKSGHKYGKATDWSVTGMNCDNIRELLKSKLEEFNIRVEDYPGSGWVHTDNMPVISNRFFKP